jgi:hypothetical protein
MENNASSKFIKKHALRLESSKQSKMIRRFYMQFLEMLSRKTDAEKRIEIYGKDPFK